MVRSVTHLQFVVGTGTHVGITRNQRPNEDSLFALQGSQTHELDMQTFGLFAVADGMGGHAYGREASRLVIHIMSNTIMPMLLGNAELGEDTLLELLLESVQRANGAMYQFNQQHAVNMGTTITAVLIVGTTAYVANVGDSRTFLWRENRLTQVTDDHSVVARLVNAGTIAATDVYTHPKRNQLYRNIGRKPEVEVDIFTVPLQPHDKLLLCSDGLWEMVHESALQRIMSTPVTIPCQTIDALIEAALHGGGKDNVSAIVVFVV